MGGFGSGRPGGSGRGLVEESTPLDLGKLIREGLVAPGERSGTLVWRVVGTGERVASAAYRGRLDPDDGTGDLTLAYVLTRPDGRRERIEEVIALEGAQQPFGGRMWFMRCPRTGRRCRKLYRAPGAARFAARQAHGLAYASQHESARHRAVRAAQKLRERLGASIVIGDPVTRPPGMKRTTFARLLARLHAHERRVEAALNALLTP